MTGESQVEEPRTEAGRIGRTTMASRGSIDGLRGFIEEEYRGDPPIPEDEGMSGVRYEYDDGSRIEAWGERWTWFAPDGKAPKRYGWWNPAALRQPQGAKDTRGEPR